MKMNIGAQEVVITPGNDALVTLGVFAGTFLMVRVICISEGEFTLVPGTAAVNQGISLGNPGEVADGQPAEYLPFTDLPDKDEVKN